MKLLLLAVFLGAFALTDAKLKTQVFELTPHSTAGNGGISSRGEKMPLPEFKHKLAIQYWGGWEVVDASTGKELPRPGGAFFHHITVFRSQNGESEFMTGCSDDRRTLGAELKKPYLQLIHHNALDSIQGFYHVINLMPRTVNMTVRYTVKYYADDDIPEDTIFVKAYFMSTAYNVPGKGGPDSIHTYVTEATAPTTGRIIAAVGHLHQGAENVTLIEKRTQKLLLTSKAIYAEDKEKDKCFYQEWCAQSGTPKTRNRVKDLELVTDLDIPIHKDTKWQLVSYYDNAAEYRTVMAWIVIFVDENSSSS